MVVFPDFVNLGYGSTLTLAGFVSDICDIYLDTND